jgi:hypothetical protein
MLGKSVQALNVLRHRGRGPRYEKVGCWARYTPEAIAEYLARRRPVRNSNHGNQQTSL